MALMDQPLTIVERAYEAWRERDYVETLCVLHPEVRWHQEDGLPYGGDYVGRGAVAQLLQDLLSDFGRFEIKPTRFAACGGLVAVIGTYEGEGRLTRFHFEDRFVHLWNLADERADWMGLYRTSGPALRDLDARIGPTARTH
jgi:ketosteroid isomerase-like protein